MENNKNKTISFYLIYGNQPLEIKESCNRIVSSLLKPEDQAHSYFIYNAKDLASSDKSLSSKLVGELERTAATISFFGTTIVIQIDDIQKLSAKKSAIDTLLKDLKEINLIRLEQNGQDEWFDADSLKQPSKTHHHITGGQLITEVQNYGQKKFYLELVPEFKGRLIFQEKGEKSNSIEIQAFLKSKLKRDIIFSKPENQNPIIDGANNQMMDLLNRYLDTPPSNIVFVLTANIKNLKEINNTLKNKLEQKANILKTTISYDDFRPVGWILNRAKQKGLKIEREAAELLIEISGTDYTILNMELEKLSILLPPNSELTTEVLTKSITHSKRFTIFRAAEFLMIKDLNNAMACIEQIVGENNSDAVGVFSLIVAQFRRVLKIAWLVENGEHEKKIVQKLKIHPWVVKQSLKHARSYKIVELENIVIHLSKIDLKVKYAAKDVLIILQNLCLLICNNSFKTRKYIDRHWLPG
jgi:DNA polymerase III delta subunit